MKRLTAAILALVITLSLCACGATGNTGAASAGNKPKKIEKPVADTLDGILEAIVNNAFAVILKELCRALWD